MPEICLRDAPVFDPDWGIHQPPPYSPRQDMAPISFVCGVEGQFAVGEFLIYNNLLLNVVSSSTIMNNDHAI